MKQIKLQNKETAKAKGIHEISICDGRSDRAQKLSSRLEDIRVKYNFIKRSLKDDNSKDRLFRELWQEYDRLIGILHGNYLKSQVVVKNVTTTVGRSVLAQRLAGTTTYTGTVNYGALGTSATAAAVGDTTLGAETYRKALSSGTYLNNVAYLENFYTTSEVNGTFEEYGFFIDGTSSADTGQMFNRFVQTQAKAATETLNVRSVITLNDA